MKTKHLKHDQMKTKHLDPDDTADSCVIYLRHPDHNPNLVPNKRYRLKLKGATDPDPRAYIGAYLNQTCWDWSFDYEAVEVPA